MTLDTPPLVEGESPQLIFEALREIDLTKKPVGGLVRISGYLSGESGAAFLRAIHRVDEEFLANDIEAGRGRPRSVRTDGQRRHDALFELMERVAKALETPP